MTFNYCNQNCKISLRQFICLTVLVLMVCLIYLPKNFEGNFYFRSFNEENMYNPSPITLKREDIYPFIVRQMKTNSTEYLQRLNNTLNLSILPEKIVIKEISSPMKFQKELHIKYNESVVLNGKNYTIPLFTARPIGRLGNVMGQYASLFALGKLYNVTVFLHPSMDSDLRKIFPNISMEKLPSEFNKSSCTDVGHENGDWSKYYPTELAAAGLLGQKCFLLKDYPFHIKLFNAIKEDIFQEFKFSPQIKLKANEFLSSIQSKAENILGEVLFTYIGLHIRRTDYQGHLKVFGGILPGYFYVERALEKTREKFKNAIFIASSDNIEYAKKIIGKENDVFFSEGNSPEVDMAILSSCNHSIMTVGTFGFWASYLAGGDVFCADSRSTKLYEFTPQFYEEGNLTNFIIV